jgi:hypothetical protein
MLTGLIGRLDTVSLGSEKFPKEKKDGCVVIGISAWLTSSRWLTILIIYYYYYSAKRFPIRGQSNLKLNTSLKTMISKVAPPSQSTHLPVELWTEIISYLPRYNLKPLLIFQPHPLGKIASHIYFSTLSLHLGVFGSQLLCYDMYRSWYESTDEFVKGREELIKWHNKRSRDILTTIVESDFGNRIQKLKIYAGSDDETDTLALQIGAVRLLGF